LQFNRTPTPSDFNPYMNLGTLWMDTLTHQLYALTNVVNGTTATWTPLGNTAAGATTFITDVNSPAHVNGTTISILGDGTTIQTSGVTANTVTLSYIGTSGLTWTRETSANVQMLVNNGYVNTNAGLTTFTLPAVATTGDIIEIMGESAALWTIVLNAGQSINVGNVATTVTTGHIDADNRYDSIKLQCRDTNTAWTAVRWTGAIIVI